MSENLTPLERTYLLDCAGRGGTRCNDGGMADTILSILCSKPSPDDPYVRWTVNPNSRVDGYISLYTATPRGVAAVSAETSLAPSTHDR